MVMGSMAPSVGRSVRQSETLIRSIRGSISCVVASGRLIPLPSHVSLCLRVT